MRLTKPHYRRRSRAALAAAGWAVLSVVGCGGTPTAKLSGEVTLGGEPIPSEAEAVIGFRPRVEGDVETVTAPIRDGRYSATGVPQGEVVAEFRIVRPVGPEKTSPRTGQTYQEEENLVPRDKLSGIVIDVTGDNANQDFQL